MPLINESYDSLPYIDAPPDDASLANAKQVIAADIQSAGIDTSQLHPSLIPAAAYTPQFPSALEHEHARLNADPSSRLSAIDLGRYEDTSDEGRPEAEALEGALQKAYAGSEYVQGRLTQLGLLEKFGKNAWLTGNWQMEGLLTAIEAELADVRKQQEESEALRRTQQENVHGEITTLEETWKGGVGRVLEAEAAAEGLKQQILERRRAGAA